MPRTLSLIDGGERLVAPRRALFALIRAGFTVLKGTDACAVSDQAGWREMTA
ncbi:hypothetical protein [Psychromicrobium xiongbiense]|uniref:hypothetical protein n=1 Tax=Psychromicrobium xiongbiense TaxID=3051184 RepID=UPI0025529D0E|nr:hypothetical protein [Psychromicrobium sp. YIM S02556]